MQLAKSRSKRETQGVWYDNQELCPPGTYDALPTQITVYDPQAGLVNNEKEQRGREVEKLKEKKEKEKENVI